MLTIPAPYDTTVFVAGSVATDVPTASCAPNNVDARGIYVATDGNVVYLPSTLGRDPSTGAALTTTTGVVTLACVAGQILPFSIAVLKAATTSDVVLGY